MISLYSMIREDMHKPLLEVGYNNSEINENCIKNSNSSSNWDNIDNSSRWWKDINNRLEKKNNKEKRVQVRMNQTLSSKIYKVIKHHHNHLMKAKKAKMQQIKVKVNIVIILNKVRNHKYLINHNHMEKDI